MYSDIQKKPKKDALAAAYDLLARSGAISELMLREKLAKKGYDGGEINAAVAALLRARMLNDSLAMHSFVNALAKRKGYGQARIRREVYIKFGRQSAEKYLCDILCDIDFDELCFGVLQKLCAGAFPDSKEGFLKLAKKLSLRGFSSFEIRNAMESMRRSMQNE